MAATFSRRNRRLCMGARIGALPTARIQQLICGFKED
jgi:hypothetical protein